MEPCRLSHSFQFHAISAPFQLGTSVLGCISIGGAQTKLINEPDLNNGQLA